MSWYKKRLNNFANLDFPHYPDPNLTNTRQNKTLGKEISISFPVTDLNSVEDAEKISKALFSLPGVKNVNIPLHQKKVMLTYQPELLDLGSVAYTINQLGYHHVHRG